MSEDIQREPGLNADEKPRLPITLGAELLVEIVDLKLRIKSMLVGMEHGRYVMAKIFEKDLVGRFRSDDVTRSPLIVGYTHNDVVYGFRTKLLTVVSSPAKLFFIKYPEKIEKLSVRKKLRHECEVEAQAMLSNDIVELLIVDISKEGCQCVVKTRGSGDSALYSMIQVDKKIRLMARFPETDGGCSLQGVIRNAGKDEDRIRLGVVFEDMPDESRARLEDFISRISVSGDDSRK
jgi:hypothetical protein